MNFNIWHVLNWVIQNWDTVISIALMLTALVKSTRWGKNNARALEAVAKVIEEVDRDGDVKAAIAARQEWLSGGEQRAIRDAVRVADPKKIPTKAIVKVLETVVKGRK